MESTKKPTSPKAKKKEDVKIEAKEAVITDTATEKKEEAPVETAPVPAAATKKQAAKIDPNTEFACRSVVAGELILIGPKSKLQYTWSDFGDVCYVSYQDLQSLQSMRSNFLVQPWFIIEDADLYKMWENMLKPVYDKAFFEDINKIFDLPISTFTSSIRAIPEVLKDTVKVKAAQMISSGALYDIRKIKAIDEACGTTLIDILD